MRALFKPKIILMLIILDLLRLASMLLVLYTKSIYLTLFTLLRQRNIFFQQFWDDFISCILIYMCNNLRREAIKRSQMVVTGCS